MEALGIDVKLLLAQVINFILFLFIFKRFLSKPFFEWLKKEKEKDSKKSQILAALEEKEQSILKNEKEIVSASQTESAKIIQEAKKTALKMREELVKKAVEEADEIRSKAREQINEERKKLYDEVRTHIIVTSAALTKRVISGFVTAAKQEEIFNKLVQDLDKNDVYEN